MRRMNLALVLLLVVGVALLGVVTPAVAGQRVRREVEHRNLVESFR